MNFFTPLRPLLLGWLLSLAIWVALAFVVAFAVVANTPLTWIEAMQAPVRDWLPWTLAAPLLFRFVNRHPLERERWPGRLAAHVVALACVTLLAWGWARYLDIRPGPGLERFGGSFEQRFARFGPHPRDRGPRGPFPEDDDGPRRGAPPPLLRRAAIAEAAAKESNTAQLGTATSEGGFARILGRVLSTHLVLACAAHAALFYRRAKEREASLAIARLEALRMQLQPHFLFNTLNTISGLVHTEPDRADTVVTSLAELLRLTLETSAERELPLRQEMRFVEAYLAIMQARFEDRIRHEIALDPGTDTALVPAFILQPLLENAVRHGLEPLPAGGTITLRAFRENNRLLILVGDDGIGLPSGVPVREGVGLGNTRARLRALHGDDAALRVRPAGRRGCLVELDLPFRTA